MNFMKNQFMKKQKGAGLKRMLCVLLVLVTVVSGVWMVSASSVDKLQQDIQNLKDKQEQIDQQLETTQTEQDVLENSISEGQDKVAQQQEQVAKTEENVKKLDEQLGVAVQELTEIEAQKTAKEQEVAAIKVELEQAELEKAKQYEDMKSRIKYMYEQGNKSYLSVILSAGSAVDMLNKLEYITEMSRYDRGQLESYKSIIATISSEAQRLSTEEANLSQLVTSAEVKKTEAESLLAAKNEELALQEKQLLETQTLLQQYEAQLAEQTAIIAALEAEQQANISKQDAAIAALASAMKNAEQANKDQAEKDVAQAVLNKLAQLQQDIDNSLAGDGSYNITVDPNTLFVWPCPSSTRITSPYGYRIHPVYGDRRFHNGIDVGAALGEPLIATYQGKVMSAGYNNSMGYYVMIDHGQGLISIYMHASKLYVSNGEKVKTGQVIALVGSTGVSTGPHLHFSIRLNGEYQNPLHYVSK